MYRHTFQASFFFNLALNAHICFEYYNLIYISVFKHTIENYIYLHADEGLMKMNKIEEFLDGLPKNTESAYRTGLNKYLAWFEKKYPGEKFNDYIKDIRLMEAKEKIQTTDRYEKDIRGWVIELKKKYAPKTISTDIASVRGLLSKNRIDLDKIFWKEIKNIQPGTASLCEVIVSTPQELKKILQHAPDVRAKSFFMALATNGMRLSELCNLKMNDIKLDY